MRARRPNAGARCARASRAVVAVTTSAVVASLSPTSRRGAVRRTSENSPVRDRAVVNLTSVRSGRENSSREKALPGLVSGHSVTANRSIARVVIADRATKNSVIVNPRGISLTNARSAANGPAASRRLARAGRVAMMTVASVLHVTTAPNVLLTGNDQPPVLQTGAPATATTDLTVRPAAIGKRSVMSSLVRRRSRKNCRPSNPPACRP